MKPVLDEKSVIKREKIVSKLLDPIRGIAFITPEHPRLMLSIASGESYEDMGKKMNIDPSNARTRRKRFGETLGLVFNKGITFSPYQLLILAQFYATKRSDTPPVDSFFSKTNFSLTEKQLERFLNLGFGEGYGNSGVGTGRVADGIFTNTFCQEGIDLEALAVWKVIVEPYIITHPEVLTAEMLPQ